MPHHGWPPLTPGWGEERAGTSNFDHAVVRAGIARTVREACTRWREELAPGSRLLDVGCGCQPYRPWIEHAGLRYSGIDREPEPETPCDSTVAWDLTSAPWPYPDARFDALLCTELLEHVPDPGGVLRECARVCRPGALMVLTAPFVWPEHEAPHDFHRFTRYGLAALAEGAGFRVEAVHPRGGWGPTLGQLAGFWAVHGAPTPRGRLVRILARLLVAALDRPEEPSPHPLPLGFSLFARRA